MKCEERKGSVRIRRGRNAGVVTLRAYHRDGSQTKDLDDGGDSVQNAHGQGGVLEARYLICGRNKYIL